MFDLDELHGFGLHEVNHIREDDGKKGAQMVCCPSCKEVISGEGEQGKCWLIKTSLQGWTPHARLGQTGHELFVCRVALWRWFDMSLRRRGGKIAMPR